MHHYHHRAFYIGVVALALIAVGLLALNFPVFLGAFDQYGFQIKCGTGYVSDLSQAAATAGEHDFVDQCKSALLTRRMWAIPMVAIGSIVLLIAVAASATIWGRESAFGKDHVA